jgi:mono/diheme cytochrome c family protein
MKIHLYQVGFVLLMMSPAMAVSPAEQRGKTFALTNCGRCHSIDRVTQSPLKIAPPFRTLHLRFGRRHRNRSSDDAGVPA